jgi:hypothetical protein
MIQVQRLPWLFGGRTRYDCEIKTAFTFMEKRTRSLACERVLMDFRDICSPTLSICEEIMSGNWENIAAIFESALVERAKKENASITSDPNWLHSLLDRVLFGAGLIQTSETFWKPFFQDPQKWLEEVELNKISNFSILKTTLWRLYLSSPYEPGRNLIYEYLRKLGLSEGISCLQSGTHCPLGVSYVSQTELRQAILQGDGTTLNLSQIPLLDRIPYLPNAEEVDAFMTTWNPIFELPFDSQSLIIESFIGEGCNGIVFKVFDKIKNVYVTIKFDHFFKYDYSMIFKINSNPRIAKWIAPAISEVIISEGLPLRYHDRWLAQPGFVMEFVETYEGKVSDFCGAMQVMSAAKAFVDEGISHTDMTRDNILYSKEVVSIHPKFQKCPKIKIIDLDSFVFINQPFNYCNYLVSTYRYQFRLRSYDPDVPDALYPVELTQDELDLVIVHLTEIFTSYACQEEFDQVLEHLGNI